MKYLKITTLDKGWQDRDEILLHAAFQVLVDFMEGESPAEIIDWDADAVSKKAWDECNALYRWWTKIRPKRKSPLEDKRLKIPPMLFEDDSDTGQSRLLRYDKKKYAAYARAVVKAQQQEKEFLAEDQLNLHRLIEVRPMLWT